MAETGTSGNPAGKGLRIALAVSVAVNLAVAGLVIGAVFKDGGQPVRDLGFGPYTEALSRDDRAALRRSFLDKAPDLRSTRKEMQRDLNDLLAALRAEPFDAGRLAQVLDAQGERLARQLTIGQQLMHEFFISMPADARLAFADRLEEGLRRGKKP